MLKWMVYVSDFNNGTIETMNVFERGRFTDDFGKFAKKLERNKELPEKDKKEQFAERLRKDLMYYYWSKCEWEIILSHWPPRNNADDLKIDVYDQIMLNWDVFLDYVWNNRRQLWTKRK